MRNKATFNPILTTTAVKFMQNAKEFAGSALFPTFLTGERAANYYVFDRENFVNVPKNIQRAPGSAYKRTQMVLSDDSYSCKNYGVEEPIDDSEKANYASALDADKSASARATSIVALNHELRCYDKATSAAVPSSTPSTKWDQAGATPIADIDAAREIIHTNCGMDANTLVMSRDVFNVLKERADILDKIKYTQKGIITADLLAAVFGVDRVVVAGAQINTAPEGQTMAVSKIWGDSVVLAHVNTAQDLKAPNFGRTFNWAKESGTNGIQIKSYREDNIDSDIHRACQHTDEKLIGAECGYHLSSVLT